MIKNSVELIQAQNSDPRVINGVDNANLMSVDSTEPIEGSFETVDENGKVVEKAVEEEEDEEIEKDLEESEEEAEDKEPLKETETDEDESEDEKEVYSKKVQKRIGQMTKKIRTRERELEYEREKRIEAEKKLKEFQSKLPAEDKPKMADFETEEEFLEALTDWKVESKLKASHEKVIEKIEDEDERKAVTEVYEGFDKARERGIEKYEDFDELTGDDDLVCAPFVLQIALDSETPEDIMYYLASNPEEPERISSLSEIKAAKEIGKIEVKLAGKVKKKVEETKSEKPKPVKKKSNAPEPISPVTTSGLTDKDPSQMSMKEYRAWRESKK